MLAFWLSLGFLLAAFTGGTAYAAARGWRAWRDLKASGRRIGNELGRVVTAAEDIELHLERASAGSERLVAALDRLRVARARLEVQRAALREARDLVGRTVPFLPPR